MSLKLTLAPPNSFQGQGATSVHLTEKNMSIRNDKTSDAEAGFTHEHKNRLLD